MKIQDCYAFVADTKANLEKLQMDLFAAEALMIEPIGVRHDVTTPCGFKIQVGDFSQFRRLQVGVVDEELNDGYITLRSTCTHGTALVWQNRYEDIDSNTRKLIRIMVEDNESG